LGYADISIAAGASIMVHDPEPPTAIGIDVQSQCPNVGIVELLRGSKAVASAVGKGTTSLAIPAGKHDYQVRCLSESGELSEALARGNMTVVRDSGTEALAKTPPATGVNVDGRSYTVLYQNRLPAVTLRWPNAPTATSYVINVSSPDGPKQISTTLPVHTMKSGALVEGTHQFQFQASNGRTSRSTTVAIRFDNAAPKASIRSPASGGFAPGGAVSVSGTALPGWKVSVGGTSLPMDSQHRFSGQAVAGSRGLVLRFEHESRGVHHYLRRASGIPR
jgi:hypothetical protein